VIDIKMEWISVKDNLPPQNLPVIVKNGKMTIYYVIYHYKKWYFFKRTLRKVTHWKFSKYNKSVGGRFLVIKD
jgi:hypothetical protein